MYNACMNDTVLYRKYRPREFNEVLGQEHIVKALQGAMKQKNVAHAYLFAGSRGTGKTSIARILAHAIGTTDNDIYEIDAASNRGIDDVRALRDGVNTLPLESPQKVYIIDEVHMLTKEAFNALLKTLEEPPKHVIFILATTEFDKLPDTIVSRCQTFRFHKPSQKTLRDMVVSVAKKEGATIDAAGAELIALLGDGSFRDTHGILQKVLGAAESQKISAVEVEAITGAPGSALVNDIVRGVIEKNSTTALMAVSKAREQNIDMHVMLKLVLQKMRAILLVRFAKDMEAELAEDFTDEDFVLIKKYAQNKDVTINSQTILEMLHALDTMRYAAIPTLPLELAIVNLTTDSKSS